MKYFYVVSVVLLCACGDSFRESETSALISIVEITDTLDIEFDGLAAVGSMCYLENGDLAVLDNLRNEIHIYREGEHFASISAIGEGPFEYTSPTEISNASGGGFLLNCPSDMKILIFNDNYECVEQVLFNGCDLRPGTPVRVEMLNPHEIVGQNYFYNDVTDCGTEVSIWNISDPANPIRTNTMRRRIAPRFHPIDYMMNTRMAFSVDPEWQLISISDVSTESYRIDFLTPSDSLVASIQDDSQQAVPKTPEELEAEISRVRQAWIRGTGSDIGFQYEPNSDNFIIIALHFASDGSLWVRKCSPTVLQFDLYGSDLSKRGEYEIEQPDRQLNDGWMVAIGDSVLAVAAINPELKQYIYTARLL